MKDRRDYLIAVLSAMLLLGALGAGYLLGRSGGVALPAAQAQDGSGAPSGGVIPAQPGNGAQPGGGITIGQDPLAPLKNRNTSSGATASDSDSNNRFVAVTSPIGSGESVLFLVDSEREQIAIYRFDRNKGLKFLAARKIDYDLKIDGYQDMSEFTRAELRQEYHKQAAAGAAKAAKK